MSETFKCVFNCCGRLCLIVIPMVIIVPFLIVITDYARIDRYKPTRCLIKNKYLKTCGTATLRTGVQECFQTKWLIELADYKTNKSATITGSKYWIKKANYPSSHQEHKFKQYQVLMLQSMSKTALFCLQVGMTHPCYYIPSSFLIEVQWKKPTFSLLASFIIFGSASVLFCIVSTVIIFCIKCTKCRVGNNNDNRRSTALWHTTRVPVMSFHGIEDISVTPTTPAEENILLTPPPPYVSSEALAEDYIPATPPPPYMSLSVHALDESIPLTPPPPYASIRV